MSVLSRFPPVLIEVKQATDLGAKIKLIGFDLREEFKTTIYNRELHGPGVFRILFHLRLQFIHISSDSGGKSQRLEWTSHEYSWEVLTFVGAGLSSATITNRYNAWSYWH